MGALHEDNSRISDTMYYRGKKYENIPMTKDGKYRVAFYGSLKKGRYNHSIIEGYEPIFVSGVDGKMYSMGSYPALVLDDDGSNHEVEVYEIDTETFKQIAAMEIGAGYNIETIKFNGGMNEPALECVIFTMDAGNPRLVGREIISKY